MGISRFLGSLALAIAALAWSAGVGAAQGQPQPFSASERALAVQALAANGVEAGAQSDEALRTLIVRDAELRLGQRLLPSKVDRLWALAPARRDVAAEMEAARADGRFAAWLASLDPAGPDYAALGAERRRYQAIAAQGGWRPLPPGGPIRPGYPPSPAIASLRERLQQEGYSTGPAADPAAYDEALQAAVKAFQRRHDLDEDAVVGPGTRRALDVGADFRLMQLEANLERLRWLPRTPPEDRVEVDTGQAQLRLFRGGKVVLAMRAVVGDSEHETPMFASRLEAVVFNPPWNVPASIAAKEILPKAARDPGYLARNNYVRTPAGLQQKPGPGNALGRLKFDLDSPFGVYLHDTPGRAAFERRARALSHGCMRLEKPRELAAALMGAQGWKASDIDAAVAAGTTRRVALEQSIALFVVHRTVVADEEGWAVFSPDVYGWDAKLAAALEQRQVAASIRIPAASECSASPPARAPVL